MSLRKLLVSSAALLIAAGHVLAEPATDPVGEKSTNGLLSVVVMDPLAAPLSCPCVEGYAQRDYDKLGGYLAEQLGRPVQVTFAESLAVALRKDSCPYIDVVIGKDSVVRSDAYKLGQVASVVGRLTDQQGVTTQTGLIVVRSGDPAQSVKDLGGYRILFGPADCDEKFAAPRQLLAEAGIEVPAPNKSEVSSACSDGACKIIEWGDSEQAAAVISSYAAPLLEGCGTIDKGDLRVVAETAPTPFITAFTTDHLPEADAKRVRTALLSVIEQPELLLALESMEGFVEPDETYAKKHGLKSQAVQTPRMPPRDPSTSDSSSNTTPSNTTPSNKKKPSDNADWTGFRGPTANGRVAWLPKQLPNEPEVLWRAPLLRAGLGGVAATSELVLIGDRDLTNSLDVWRCYDAVEGTELWTLEYPALGSLDYDNTPRATPVIADGKAYLQGAFGDLHCVDLDTGEVLWATNLRTQYSAEHELVWGTCATPLLVGDNLIVSPGGPDAGWVALDAATGVESWRGPGDRHAYATPIVRTHQGAKQLIAYDRTSLGGWDAATGVRLWTLTPPIEGDFNVPSPLLLGDQLLLTSENNGARLHRFDPQGRPIDDPAAFYRRLSPDMSSPIVVGDRIFCVCDRLFCLSASDLSEQWIGGRRDFPSFAPLIASEDRLLTIARGGDLLLIDTKSKKYRVVSRAKIFNTTDRDTELYSQPAIVEGRLYARGDNELVCVRLDG